MARAILFDMASRRHECVATHCGVAAQERDVEAVVVEQLFVFHAGFTGHDGADEAATGPDATLIGCGIKRDTLGHSPHFR
jgi:hypothetical protein